MNFDCTVEPFACGSMKSSNVQQMHEGNILVEFSVNPFFHLYKKVYPNLTWKIKERKKIKSQEFFFQTYMYTIEIVF